MPKATKLHNKGKPNSIQKHHKPETTPHSSDPEESMRQFQLELCWCIQQLERTLNEKKGSEKQLEEAWKVLMVLKNNSQPVIRKRQLMRTHFGDYRAKMAAEEKKLIKMASKMRITEATEKPKAKFLRKSAFLSMGDNSFRFNFSLPPEQSNAPTTEVTPQNIVYSKKENETENNINKIENNNENPFKFTHSITEFKFNFNVNT